MKEIEEPLPDFYDVKVTFRKTTEGERNVTVTIRSTKRGHARKREFSDENLKGFFPEGEGISDRSLYWRLHHKEHLAVYHRRNINEYIGMDYSLATTDLSQKLEILVFEAHKGFAKTGR
ncbi:MAG: hypothetical protein AABX79_01905 [Nanoarchaeota archaeon]